MGMCMGRVDIITESFQDRQARVLGPDADDGPSGQGKNDPCESAAGLFLFILPAK